MTRLKCCLKMEGIGGWDNKKMGSTRIFSFILFSKPR